MRFRREAGLLFEAARALVKYRQQDAVADDDE